MHRSQLHRASLSLLISVSLAACVTDDGAATEDNALTAQTGVGSGSGMPPGSPPTSPPSSPPTSPPSSPPTSPPSSPPTSPGETPSLPSEITGVQLTLAYEGPASYTLPAWNTLPAVQVVDQLLIARYAQPDFTGPVTVQSADLFLHVVGDPHVDTYVFGFVPGTPGETATSFQASSGDWYRRVAGAPSQAGPPYTGRPELIMSQAIATTWTPLTEWSVPNLFTAHGWPSANAAHTNTITGSIILSGTAAIASAIYGAAALGAYGGGPLCRPATATCGASVVGVSAAFVASYVAMQGFISGQDALKAAGAVVGASTVATLIARWRNEFMTRILPAVRGAFGTCSAAATTCGAEGAHICYDLAPTLINLEICRQDTWLTTFNGAAFGYAFFMVVGSSIDLGITLFQAFGVGAAR